MLHSSFSIIIATTLLLRFVDPQILYLLMHAASNESQAYITVDEDGQAKGRPWVTHQWTGPSALARALGSRSPQRRHSDWFRSSSSRAAHPAAVLPLAGQLEAWATR